ncbi:MAG: hypothetical protein AAF384_19850 [Pseudomonadota bacterium]
MSTAVPYMERTRLYYEAQGYEKPYVWAHFDEVPFAPLKKPLSSSSIALVTTAMPDESFKAPNRRLHIGSTDDVPEAFFTDDLAWDKEATHTRDLGSFFPISELRGRVAAAELGALAPRYFGVPTNYSHRGTIQNDAPKIVECCIEDEVDVAMLVPL